MACRQAVSLDRTEKPGKLLAGLRHVGGELAEPAEEGLVGALGGLAGDLGADLGGLSEVERSEMKQAIDLVVDVENVESMKARTRRERMDPGRLAMIGVFPGFAAEKRKFE